MCDRSFRGVRGLSLHQRSAHPKEYHVAKSQQNRTTNSKLSHRTWNPSEEKILADAEIKLNVRNVNMKLAELFPYRSLESIKSHRKSSGYRKLINDLRIANHTIQNNCPITNPITTKQSTYQTRLRSRNNIPENQLTSNDDLTNLTQPCIVLAQPTTPNHISTIINSFKKAKPLNQCLIDSLLSEDNYNLQILIDNDYLENIVANNNSLNKKGYNRKSKRDIEVTIPVAGTTVDSNLESVQGSTDAPLNNVTDYQCESLDRNLAIQKPKNNLGSTYASVHSTNIRLIRTRSQLARAGDQCTSGIVQAAPGRRHDRATVSADHAFECTALIDTPNIQATSLIPEVIESRLMNDLDINPISRARSGRDNSSKPRGRDKKGRGNDRPMTSKRNEKRRAKRDSFVTAQRLFTVDRSTLLRRIVNSEPLVNNNSISPNLSMEKMLEFWGNIMSAESPPFTGKLDEIISDSNTINNLISVEEVRSGLKALYAGAPGLDRLRKADLLKVGVETLTQRFNIYLNSTICPTSFKDGLTTLIPKVPRPGKPSEFRPITVSSISARLFHKILACRLERCIELNIRQKAFQRRDGIAENIFLLKNIIAAHTSKCKPIIICFLDVSKAFDSVSHEAIIELGRRVGIPERELKYIRNLYSNSNTRIKHNGSISEKIRINRGVKQGDPLSPLLFNAVMDYVTSKLDNQLGIQLNKHSIDHLAFADDLVIFADDKAAAEIQINKLIDALKDCGLKLNPSKCASIQITTNRRAKSWVCDPTPSIRVAGAMIRSLNISEGYKYLGIMHGADIHHCSSPIEKYSIDCAKIGQAPLKPHQKVDLLINRLIPSLMHQLVFSYLPKTILTTLDRISRASIRAWLRLPTDFTLAAFHAPGAVGGLAVPRLELTVPLLRHIRIGKITRENSDDVICTLSTSTVLKWGKPPSIESTIIASHSDLKIYHTEKLLQTIDGSGLDRGDHAPFVNNWIRNNANSKLINAHNYVDIFKLKHNALQSPARIKRAYHTHSTKCDACSQPYCTLHHILQKCPRTHEFRIKRHDRVNKLLTDLLQKVGYRVFQEQHFKTTSGIKKPDVIATRNKMTYVIDTQICSDSIDPDVRYEDKRKKYDIPEIRTQTKILTKATNIEFAGCILNWRGTPSRKTVSLLLKLGLSKRDIELMSIRRTRFFKKYI